MPAEYVYVDDEDARTIGSFGTRLERQAASSFGEGALVVRAQFPEEFQLEVDGLARLDGVEEYGVILDMRLDQAIRTDDSGVGAQGHTRRRYTGAALAQELRTRASMPPVGDDPGRWAFPIVLLALAGPFRDGYRREQAAQDLFDLAFIKDELASGHVGTESAGAQLVALARGYSRLRSHRRLSDIIGPLPEGVGLPPALSADLLDERVPVHGIARAVLSDLILPTGLLVDESTLFARLGVDVGTSGEALTALHTFVGQARYKGVFHEGWRRWWWAAVDRLLAEHTRAAFRMLDAAARVSWLSRLLGVEFAPQSPVSSEHGTRFWVVCVHTLRAIDPEDAIRCRGPALKPWIEPRYADILHAIESLADSEIAPEELSRLRDLRQGHFDGDQL